jgi:hypothetical protein
VNSPAPRRHPWAQAPAQEVAQPVNPDRNPDEPHLEAPTSTPETTELTLLASNGIDNLVVDLEADIGLPTQGTSVAGPPCILLIIVIFVGTEAS